MKGWTVAVMAALLLVCIAAPATAQYVVYDTAPTVYSTAPVYTSSVYMAPGVAVSPVFVRPVIRPRRVWTAPAYYSTGPILTPVYTRPVIIRRGFFGQRYYMLE